MKKLQKLLAAAVLTSVICVSAFADSPTCPPPDPGIISTPPCGQASSDGDTDEPTASTTTAEMDTSSSADSYITIAVSVFESRILLF